MCACVSFLLLLSLSVICLGYAENVITTLNLIQESKKLSSPQQKLYDTFSILSQKLVSSWKPTSTQSNITNNPIKPFTSRFPNKSSVSSTQFGEFGVYEGATCNATLGAFFLTLKMKTCYPVNLDAYDKASIYIDYYTSVFGVTLVTISVFPTGLNT